MQKRDIISKKEFASKDTLVLVKKVDFKTIFESVPCSYLVLCHDFTIVGVSEEYLKATQTKRENLIDKYFYDAFPSNPEDKTGNASFQLMESLNFIIKNKISHAISLQRLDMLKPDGSFEEKYWNMLNSPVLNKQNEVEYFILRMEDVSGFVISQNKKNPVNSAQAIPSRALEMEIEVMKRSMEIHRRNEDLEKKVSESSAQLDLIYKDIADYKYALEVSTIVSVTDKNGIIQDVNDNFCIVTKYSKDEIIGKDHRVLNSGYHSKEFMKKLWSTISSGNVWKGEVKNKAKDGTFYWVETTIVPFLDNNGKPYKYLAIRKDVTKRKLAFEKIQTSEANYKELFDNSAVSIFISDTSAVKPMAVNDVAAKTFGYKSKKEFVEHFDGRLHYVNPEAVEKNIALIKERGELHSIQEMKRLDGSRFWVNAYVKVNVEKKQMYTFLIDITKEMQLKSEIDMKIRELESKNKDLEVFNFISTHDLQEPLRKIQNLISVLLSEEKDRLSEEGKMYLKKSYQTSQKMRKLLNDLLLYSRVKNASFNFEKKEFKVIALEIIEDYKEIIREKNAIIDFNADCEINIIPFQFQQVIHNLISNALKFTTSSRQPHIKISCKTVKGSKLKIPKISPKLSYSHISISDNGIGFDSEYKDRIFEVFQRLYTSEKYEGTGIGLAICKKIVENHNGVITAMGKLKKGAKFDIYIPVDQN
ncbi:MAG: PAS domain S-box protein [Bacteroidota bacterium]